MICNQNAITKSFWKMDKLFLLHPNSIPPNLNPSQQSHQGGAPSYNAVAYQPCNNVNNAVVYQPSANVVYQPSAVNNAIASGVANGVANAVANAVTYQPCRAVNSHH